MRTRERLVEVLGTIGEVQVRVATLQVSCPYRLTVMAKVLGTDTLERFLHQDLHQHRLQGEWFKRCPEVLKKVRWAGHRQKSIEDELRRIEEAWNSLPEEVRRKIEDERKGIYG